MSWHFDFRRVGGHRYLYLVEKKRTPKGPRNVRHIYVGTPDKLLENLSRPLPSLKSFRFGTAAALLRAARETGLLPALERYLPGSAGAQAARLVFLQILGRAERPLSREGMAHWYPDSALPFLGIVKGSPSAKSLRPALHELFDTGAIDSEEHPILTRARVHKIEESVLRSLVGRGLHPRYLFFDGTNFFSYHKGDRWFARGRNKQKRFDLNQVALGLATAETVPVLSEVYEGNLPDVKAFALAFDALLKRLEHLEVSTEEMTLVFDRGNNSTGTFEEVLGLMHVIAAIDRQQARKLLALPRQGFREVCLDSDARPILGRTDEWTGFGRTWRALVVYREGTAREQRSRWERTKKEVLETVAGWRTSLAEGRSSGRMVKSWMRDLVELIPRDYQGLFDYRLEKSGGVDWPVCEVNLPAEERLRDAWGKTVLISDLPREKLSDEELVKGWLAKWEVEDDFRWLKDRYVMSVKPIWVWHEAVVPGHIFVCVMGLMLLRYLQWRVRDLGFTMKELVETLERIRLVVAIRDGSPQVVLEQLGRREAELVDRLQLLELVPTVKGPKA